MFLIENDMKWFPGPDFKLTLLLVNIKSKQTGLHQCFICRAGQLKSCWFNFSQYLLMSWKTFFSAILAKQNNYILTLIIPNLNNWSYLFSIFSYTFDKIKRSTMMMILLLTLRPSHFHSDLVTKLCSREPAGLFKSLNQDVRGEQRLHIQDMKTLRVSVPLRVGLK